jgi:hypothetical protein
MRWEGGRRSTNVQDRRGMGGLAVGGGLGTVVLALVAMLFGVDPSVVLQGGGAGTGAGGPGGPGGAPPGASTGAPGQDDKERQFVETILGSTEDVFGTLLPQQLGHPYQPPQLVLFTGAERTACGTGQAAMGPFYCPGDQTVYIDLSFYNDLARMSGARGDNDFAQAYVIAHEVGHHIQTLLGTSERVARASRGAREAEANALSVRQELQADCYAGVWGHHTQLQLDPGDMEEALAAATAIGDDRLQREAQGRIVPESFTHGTSAQRVRWFRQGMETGDMRRCDTFAAEQL